MPLPDLNRFVLLAAIIWVASAAPASGSAVAATPRAVVLVTVDTLRADAVSFAGSERPTTPFLDRLAADGVVMRRAYAPSSWTSPTMASLFTGLYPTSHGVTSGVFSRDRSVLRQPVLSERFTTLAEALRDAGYLTVGVPSNRHLAGELGFGQGFDHYLERAYFLAAPKVVAKTRNQLFRAFGWEWAARWRERPVFLWIHFFDPHAPYGARKPWIDTFAPRFAEAPELFPAGVVWTELKRRFPRPDATTRAQLRPLYDTEVAFVDQQLAALSDELRLEDPDVLFILTSDHGEEFAEHGGLGHGHTLYDELVRVPLLVRWPEGLPAKGDRDQVVGLQDLYPTILELAGGEVPAGLHGESFAGALRGEAPAAPARRYFELESRDGVTPSLIGSTDGAWKLVRRRGSGGVTELYDLAADPGERDNLVKSERDRARRLELDLRRWVQGLTAPESVETLQVEDEELKRQLEALGYLDG